MKLFKKFKGALIVAILSLCLCLIGCDAFIENLESMLATQSSSESESQAETEAKTEAESESQTQLESESQIESESQTESETEAESETEKNYFVATVRSNANIVASPYADPNAIVPEALSGAYYSASTPGGEPQNDGTGKIWLTLKPVKDYSVQSINITGKYTEIKDLGRDLYCIYGVKSDLSVSVTAKLTPSVDSEILEDCGYGITDDGKMIVSWNESPEEPVRYVEVTYNDGTGTRIEYFDSLQGKAELFKMTESKIYTVSLRAIGYKGAGKRVELSGCYMKAPKDVPFPRVEITTQNYIWPECDFVSSPSGCWGAGITNAFYEQCIMTIYNDDNEAVYTSSTKADESERYLGAKMKIRGNTSAHHEQKARYPYKIKLDEKADLLEPLIGRPDAKAGYADKDWVLLNYGADGFRATGDAIADAVGTEWSPDYCYVSLYLNGEYRGIYVLSEAVEEGNGADEDAWRVSVDTDGYVFECDAYWWNEGLSFSTPLTEETPMHFTFKYPDTDYLSADSPEVKYLQDYLSAFEEALMRDDDSYLEYIDLDTFVKWLLVSDYLCIEDGGGCNLYLYKKNSSEDSKIAMGPNWDFDSYMGNEYALSTIRMKWKGAPFYYQYLVKKDSFNARYKELLNETKDELVTYVENAFAQIDNDAHNELLKYQGTRFGTSTKSLSEQKAEFLEWLEIHLEWMNGQFN